MTDDFSDVIQNASCYTINNSTSIYAYRNNTRYSYSQISGKWYLSSQATYTSIPTSSYCYTFNDLSSINSYSYMFPVYAFIAFCLAVFVFIFAYKVFWENLVKWRV